MKPPVVIGIDLGTTKCLAGIATNGKVHWIPVGSEHCAAATAVSTLDVKLAAAVLPSVFACESRSNGSVEYIGQQAISRVESAANGSGSVIRNVKRFMHRQGRTRFELGDRDYSPAEVASAFLRHLRQRAGAHLPSTPELGKIWELNGGHVDRAVITVPAHFGYIEQEATKLASDLAEFADVKLLAEPIAAAIGLNLHLLPGRKRVLIVDVGGGTTDLTLLELGLDVPKRIRELGRNGDNHHGGLDWDLTLAKEILEQGLKDEKELIQRLQGLESLNGQHTGARIGYAAEGKALSYAEDAKIRFCSSTAERLPVYHVDYRDPFRKNQSIVAALQRSWFEEESTRHAAWVAKLAEDLLTTVGEVESRTTQRIVESRWSDIDLIYLVGGGAHIPQIAQELTRLMGPALAKERLKKAPEPETLIAKGAAIYAELLARGEELAADSTPRRPHDMGVAFLRDGKVVDFMPLLPANAPVYANGTTGTVDYPYPRSAASCLEFIVAERRYVFPDFDGNLMLIREPLRFDTSRPEHQPQGWLARLGLLSRDIAFKLACRDNRTSEDTPRLEYQLSVVYGGRTFPQPRFTQSDVENARDPDRP